MLFFFQALPSIGSIGKTRKFKKACAKAKGTYHKKLKCHCPRGDGVSLLINPFERTCARKKTFGSKLDPHKLKCTLPSEWFCSKDTNPSFTDIYRKQRKVFKNKKDQLSFEVKQKKGEDKSTYQERLAKSISTRFFTEQSWNILQKVFKKVQFDLVHYITHKTKPGAVANDMILAIKNAQLNYGLSKLDTEFNFESYQLMGNVYTQGHILLSSDKNLLYFIFAHELAHTIDPCSIDQYNQMYTGNPFQRVLHCLHRKDTTHVKRASTQCFKSFIRNREEKGIKVSAFTTSALESYEKGSVCAMIGIPDLNQGETGCDNNQINEVFADWLATEVLFESINAQNIEKNLSSAVSFLCHTNYTLENLKRELQFSHSQGATHLNFLDRMNSLILNHPKYREHFQCYDSTTLIKGKIPRLQSIDEILDYEKYSNYCN